MLKSRLLVKLTVISLLIFSQSKYYQVLYVTFIKSDSIYELHTGNPIYDKYIETSYCNTKDLAIWKRFRNQQSLTFNEEQFSIQDPRNINNSEALKNGKVIGVLKKGSNLTVKKLFETNTFHGKDHIFLLNIKNSKEHKLLYSVYFFSQKTNRILFFPFKLFY